MRTNVIIDSEKNENNWELIYLDSYTEKYRSKVADLKDV